MLPAASVVLLLAVVVPACGNPSTDSGESPNAVTTVSVSTASASAEPTVIGASRTASPTITRRPSPTTTRSTTHADASTERSRSKTTGDQVTAVGDSVMVATEPNLDVLLPGIMIDAVVGRGVDDGLTALAGYADSGELRDRIVIELGTNSPFSAEQFVQLVRTVDGRPFVVVTNHCDRCSWTEANNAMLHENCAATPTCSLADWEATAQQNPQLFAEDGIHVAEGGDGAQALAELVVAALDR